MAAGRCLHVALPISTVETHQECLHTLRRRGWEQRLIPQKQAQEGGRKQDRNEEQAGRVAVPPGGPAPAAPTVRDVEADARCDLDLLANVEWHLCPPWFLVCCAV